MELGEVEARAWHLHLPVSLLDRRVMDGVGQEISQIRFTSHNLYARHGFFHALRTLLLRRRWNTEHGRTETRQRPQHDSNLEYRN